jgi:hypothetical protein
MKRFFFLAVIMLIFTAFTIQPAFGLEQPYGIGDPDQDGGDDHPWGGEDNREDPPKWKPDSNDKDGTGVFYFEYLLKPFYMYIIDQYRFDVKTDKLDRNNVLSEIPIENKQDVNTASLKTSYRGL